MAAAPRLTPEEWAKVRATWIADPRESFEWIVQEMGLPVSGAAVRKRAKAPGQVWEKAVGGAGEPAAPARAEKTRKKAVTPEGQSQRDLRGRGSVVGEPEGGAQSPPKGFRRGMVPRRRGKAAAVVIDMETGVIQPEGRGSKSGLPGGSQGSANHGSVDQGSENHGSGQKWEMNLGNDEDLWRDVAPTVRPRGEEEPRGRPTVYQNIFPNQAFRHCLLGATNEDLAALFQVSVRTINRWLVEHKEFCHAVQAGKADADARVAAAVFKRAVGFKVPEVHISSYKGEVTITEVEKFYPPDMGAAAMWLYNRQPERWRASPELPPPDPGSNSPFEAELDAVYAQSMEASRVAALSAREERQRHGLFGKRPDLDSPEEERELFLDAEGGD